MYNAIVAQAVPQKGGPMAQPDFSPPDFSPLDRPDISQNSFYPRRNRTPAPIGAEDHHAEVAPDIRLSCRFFSCGEERPTILFFYGNGETAADYDNIAPIYNQVGLNFFVADYRGYGQSGGSPSFCSMLADAHPVLQYLRGMLARSGYSPDVFVMGRSMGRHPAFELASSEADSLSGLIVESGRPNLGQFVYGLDEATAERLEDAYRKMVFGITLPVLVIHGEVDTLAPLHQAVEMFHGFISPSKRLLTIPRAGHNDLLFVGINEYFGAIHEFVANNSSGTPSETQE